MCPWCLFPLTSNTSRFPSSPWHGLAQTRFPPRPRKAAWRCDVTDALSPRCVPQTGCKHAPPQWHRLAQTHFPPRPRQSGWHSDIADVLSPRRALETRCNVVRPHRQSSRAPWTQRTQRIDAVFPPSQWGGQAHTSALSTKAAARPIIPLTTNNIISSFAWKTNGTSKRDPCCYMHYIALCP